MYMNPKVKKQMNKAVVAAVEQTFFDEIPLQSIFKAVEDAGYVVLQEDLRKWSGLLCGLEAQVYFPLGCNPNEDGVYEEVKNAVLALSWYKMTSGRYEVLAYIA